MPTAKKRKNAVLQRNKQGLNGVQTRAAGRSERPATERTLLVLARIAALGRLSVTDIAHDLGLPKATASRICERLQKSGYLMREPVGRKLTVGPRMFRLGHDIVRQSGASSARHTLLAELVENIGETCNLTMRAADEVLYIDRVETRWPLRLALEPGSRVPLHCTASGKLFLSTLAPAALEALLHSLPLPAITSRTLTTRSRLSRELKRTAARGYSVDNEEFIAGLVAVAVPITDADGEVIAALACHAPAARLSLRAAIALVPRLRVTASKIGSLMLGAPA